MVLWIDISSKSKSIGYINFNPVCLKIEMKTDVQYLV